MKVFLPKWLWTGSSVYYVLSITIHFALIILFIGFFSHHSIQPVRPTFQTAVFFESASDIKNQIETSSISRGPQLSKTFENLNIFPSLIQGNHLKREKKTVYTSRNIKPRFEVPKNLDNLKSSLRSGIKKTIPEVTNHITIKANSRDLNVPNPLDTNLFSDEKRSRQTTNSDSGVIKQNKKSSIIKQRYSGKIENKDRFSKIWKKKSDLLNYRNKLRNLVSANWVIPPISVKKYQINITANIDPNGNLINIKFTKRSDLAILDAAAERAIRVSTPFPKYPPSFDPKMSSFQAVFRFTPETVSQ